MTTHRTPAVADDRPSWAIELAPGALPCAACGAATPETRDASRTELSPEVGPVLLFHDGAQRLPGPRFTLTMCPPCQARHRAAHRLADSLPGLASHVGGDPRAALAVVLDGLAVVTTAALPRLADEDAARLLRHLREASGHVRFVGLLVPPIAEGVRPGLATREPWAHVDEVTRSDLTRGFARFLAAGVARHSAQGPWRRRPGPARRRKPRWPGRYRSTCPNGKPRRSPRHRRKSSATSGTGATCPVTGVTPARRSAGRFGAWAVERWAAEVRRDAPAGRRGGGAGSRWRGRARRGRRSG